VAEKETPEYCVRCAVKHLLSARTHLEEALASGDVNPKVSPSEIEELIEKRLMPLSETIQLCRQWNLPEEKVPECSESLDQFMDKKISAEEFGERLGKLIGKQAKVFKGKEEIKVEFR